VKVKLLQSVEKSAKVCAISTRMESFIEISRVIIFSYR